MTADWGFGGRDAELARVGGVAPQRPILVRGPAGIGKTRLAREAVRRESSAVWLAASEQLAAIRYAALTPLLSALEVTGLGDESELLARLDAALAACAEPPLLAVDDVGRADAGTLAALGLIASAARGRLILTARDTDPLPDFVRGLYVDGTLDVLELGPLDPATVERLLEEEFAGPVDPATVRGFVERSGGNPLLVRELARGALAAGRPPVGPAGIVARPAPTARLGELLGERLGVLEPGARRCAELLALTGPLDLDDRERATVLEPLEHQGLVVGAADGAVQLAHPLHAEVLIAAMPPSRLRVRRREAAHRLACDGSAEAQLRAAVLLLDSGERLPLDRVLTAAGHAVARGDNALVVRITAGVDAGAGPDARLLRLRGHALSLVGRDDVAEACLDEAIDVAVDDEQRALAARSLAEHLAVRTRRPAAAVALIDRVLPATADERWRSSLLADRARWAMLVGDRAGYTGDAGAPDNGAARLNMTMTEALVAVMAGKLTDADRHIGAGLPLAERLRAEVPNGADLLQLTRWAGLLFAGRLDHARAHAEHQAAVAGVGAEASGMWAYAHSALDLHGGRLAAAVARSADAVRLLEWRDFTGLVATARAVHATALAQLGRVPEARAAIDALGDPAALDLWAALQHAQAVGWLAVAERRRPDLEHVAAVARQGVAAGQLCLSSFVSHAAVRLGGPEWVAEDLHDAALRTEGALIPAFAAHAAALVARRPHEVLDAADRMARLGLFGAAADAARQAAAQFTAAGRPDAARRAAALAAGWADPTATTHDLTAREIEIATRAADRWSSRAIADELGVSTRTVDNHLGKVYRKLGIGGRPELAAALRRIGIHP